VRALALDLGTHLGWALYDGKDYEFGLSDFSRGHKTERIGPRLIRYNQWLTSVLVKSGVPQVDRVAFEMPHHQGGSATRWLLWLAGLTVKACAELEIPCFSLHTATLKKWTTGGGHASKLMMMHYVCERWPDVAGKDPAELDDNEADAIALLMYTLEDGSKLKEAA
jgi:Holliday junction resolvasome RuvABC endonuclease subunit